MQMISKSAGSEGGYRCNMQGPRDWTLLSRAVITFLGKIIIHLEGQLRLLLLRTIRCSVPGVWHNASESIGPWLPYLSWSFFTIFILWDILSDNHYYLPTYLAHGSTKSSYLHSA